jgi:hypothetical protein
MGPEILEDGFDETEEEEQQDPRTVYSIQDVDEGRLTITSLRDDFLRVTRDGHDVVIELGISGEKRKSRRLVVPRSAFVECLQDIGVVDPPPPV